MTEAEIAAAKVKADADAQDGVKQELEKQAQKKVFSDKEKAAFNLKKKAEEAKALGIDPKDILGVEDEPADEIPAWYKRELAKGSQNTAIQLADSITDPDVKALTKEYLSTRIVPSGDAESDFRLAYGAVNALKNKQILEDVNRRTNPRLTAAGGSQSVHLEEQFTPTADEAVFMAPPFNLSKAKVIEARQKSAAKQK